MWGQVAHHMHREMRCWRNQWLTRSVRASPPSVVQSWHRNAVYWLRNGRQTMEGRSNKRREYSNVGQGGQGTMPVGGGRLELLAPCPFRMSFFSSHHVAQDCARARAQADEWHIWSSTPIRVPENSTGPHCASAATLWHPYFRSFCARLSHSRLLLILCSLYPCSL